MRSLAKKIVGDLMSQIDDKILAIDVKAGLLKARVVEGREPTIGVEVRRGVVTLTGIVARDADRSQALEIAQSVKRTIAVNDRLLVVQPPVSVEAGVSRHGAFLVRPEEIIMARRKKAFSGTR